MYLQKKSDRAHSMHQSSVHTTSFRRTIKCFHWLRCGGDIEQIVIFLLKYGEVEFPFSAVTFFAVRTVIKNFAVFGWILHENDCNTNTKRDVVDSLRV